ncbi:MAG: hypothetical protein OER21_10775, partial [Gemmatimonadota bacterium]|nr:hypothetical protein [Gemmatimonadota bacterium]
MAPPVQPDRPDEPDRAAQVQAAIEERRKRIREQNRRAQERREMDARLRVKAEALRATGEVSQPPVLPTTNVGADDIDTARRGKAKSARLKDTLRQAQALAPQDERAARAFQQVLDGAATDLTKAPPRLTPPARDEAEERKQTEEAFTRARTVLEPGAPLVNLYGQIPAQAAQTGVAIGEGLGTFASFAPGLAGLRPTGATRRQVEAYYEQAVGAPQSRAAQVVAVLTRLTGDLTMFMVPGAIAARVPTALAALRGLQSIRSARYFQLLNLERKLEKALRPATFTRRAMLDFAFGAPVDAAISAAGPEQSIAGGLAAILGPEARLPFPGGPTFGEISRSLPGRVAFEVATGEVLALGFLGGLDRLEALRGAARGRYGPPESVFPGRQLELIQMQVRMAAGEPIDEALARATMTPWDELQWALEQRGVATMLEGPDMRERIRRVRAGAGSLRGLALMRPLAGAGAGVGVGAVLDPDETGVPRPVAMATLGLSGALLASSSLKALRNRFGYVGDLFNRVGSRMVKGVEGAPFGEAAEVNQWLKHLEKNVSKDELDFSGMRAWLAEFPPGTKVRREDIARFAQDNRMRLRVQEMAEEGDEIHLDLDPDDQIDAIYEDLPSYNETLGDEWVRDHLQEIGRGNLSAENFMERIDTQLDRQVEESGLIPVGEAAEIPEMVWDNATPRERTRWLEQVTDASDEAELREALGVDDDVDLDFDTIDEIPDRQTRNEINELLEQQHQQDFIVRDDLFTERQWTRLRAAAEEAEQLAGQASDLRGAEIPQWQAQWRTTTVDKGGGSDYVEAAVYWDPADVGIIRDGLPKNLEFDTVNRSGEGPTIWVVRDGTGSVVGSGLTKEAAHASAMAELRPWLSATGGHFENWRNVYVHIRTDQRLGKIPSGFIPDEQLALLEGAPGPVKRGLFIEEIQSDYAQNARPLRVRDTSEPWRIVTQEESAPFGAVEKLVRELQAMDVKLDPLPGGYARDPTGFLTGEIASRHAITQTVGALVSDLDERVLRRYADDLPTLLDGLPLRRFGGGGTDLPGEWFLRDINEDGVHFDLAPGSAPEAFSDVMFASVSLKDAGTRVDWPRSAIPGWQQAMASAEVIRQHKLWNAPDRLAAFWKSADQWTQVGLTYALLKAVDENLPFVAWASGNQQNALYSKLMMEQAPRVKWRTVKVPGATVGDAPRYAVLVDALDEHGNLRKRLLAFPNEARNTPGDFERAALSHVENRLGFDIGQLRNEPIHSLDEVLNERAPDVWEAVGRGEVEGEFSGTDLMVGDPSHPFVYDDKLPKIALKLKKALPGWEGEIPVGRVEFEDFIESNSRYVWRDGRGQEVTREALAEPLADFEEWTQVALDRTHAAFIATGWEGSVPLPSPAQIRNTILAGDFTRHETLVPVRKLIGETGEGLQTINRHIREIRDADNALPASAELGVQETLRRQLEQMQEVKGRWEARKIALDDYYRKVLDYSEAVRMKGRFQQRLTPAEIMVPVRGEPSEDLFKRLTGINRAVVTETVNAVPGGNQAIIITPALRDFIRKHGMVLPSIAPVPFIANFGTDDDDRRSSLELLGLLVAVGVGVAAARGIPIGVARARAFSRQLGERGIVSFGREIATALPHRTVEQEIGRLVELGRADVAANLDRFMQGSEARTVVFRGDNRGALFGNRLVKSRADVPGFYFTEDAEIASNYALNKPDHNVDTAYERWYEIPVLRTKAGRPDKRLAQPNLDR